MNSQADIATEVMKLEVGPNDVVVIRVADPSLHMTTSKAAMLYEQARAALGPDVKIAVLPHDLEMGLKTDVRLAAETYDRFHNAYVALQEALIRARTFLAHIAGRDLLDQIDDALAMKSNLEERDVVRVVTRPVDDPDLIPDKPIVVEPELHRRTGRREEP